MHQRSLRIIAATGLLALAACAPGRDADGKLTGVAGHAVEQASKGLDDASKEMEKANSEMSKAQSKLRSSTMSLDAKDGSHAPDASITPDGDIIIDGKTIDATPEQKALAKTYRKELEGVASDGIAIGMAGAKIGIDAAGAALKGLLNGDSSDEVGKQAEEAARQKIKPQVEQLCARLPKLRDAQDALAAAQPAFRPYAGMDQSDIDDCMDDNDWKS